MGGLIKRKVTGEVFVFAFQNRVEFDSLVRLYWHGMLDSGAMEDDLAIMLQEAFRDWDAVITATADLASLYTPDHDESYEYVMDNTFMFLNELMVEYIRYLRSSGRRSGLVKKVKLLDSQSVAIILEDR